MIVCVCVCVCVVDCYQMQQQDATPYNWWEQLCGYEVQHYFLKCMNTRVSECGRSEASGKGYKSSAGL